MATQHKLIYLAPSVWRMISNGLILSDLGVRVQNKSANTATMQVTVTPNEPTGDYAFEGSLDVGPNAADIVILGAHFAGVTGGQYLWAWCEERATLSVSHA